VKKIQKYLDTQLKNIKYLLRKPANEYTNDTIHQLRVRIKKLNSLLVLLKYDFKDFKAKKCIKPLKQVFRKAGDIRELQIEEDKLEFYFLNNSLPKYRSILNKNRAEFQNAFSSILESSDPAVLKKIRHYLGPFLKNVNRQRIKKYIDKSICEINKTINQIPFQNKIIHDIRKKLKNLMYIQESVAVKGNDELIMQINSLSELLGDWHDYKVTIRHLENIDPKNLTPSENREIEKIKQDFNSKSTTLLSKMNLNRLPL